MLELKQREPVATGQHRLIFDDPGDPTRLIKVMIPAIVAKKFDAPGRWHKRLARTRQYGGYLREISEYVAYAARRGAGERPPIARTLGLVETDYGLGLVVEKLVAVDGRLAPTLLSLVREHGLAPWTPKLEHWLECVVASNVILGDLHARNLVLVGAGGSDGRFVMVDGYGEKNFIPRCSMSSRFNSWHSRELYRRLLVNVVRQVA